MSLLVRVVPFTLLIPALGMAGTIESTAHCSASVIVATSTSCSVVDRSPSFLDPTDTFFPARADANVAATADLGASDLFVRIAESADAYLGGYYHQGAVTKTAGSASATASVTMTGTTQGPVRQGFISYFSQVNVNVAYASLSTSVNFQPLGLANVINGPGIYLACGKGGMTTTGCETGWVMREWTLGEPFSVTVFTAC